MWKSLKLKVILLTSRGRFLGLQKEVRLSRGLRENDCQQGMLEVAVTLRLTGHYYAVVRSWSSLYFRT